MNTHIQDTSGQGFVAGFVSGAAIGVGLAVWFAPRLKAELRQRAADGASLLGDKATTTYEQASRRVGEAVDDLTRRGQDVRDEMADAVVRGAHAVESHATAAKTESVARIKKQAAV